VPRKRQELPEELPEDLDPNIGQEPEGNIGEIEDYDGMAEEAAPKAEGTADVIGMPKSLS